MTETSHLMPAGDRASDAVVFGVAQGLSLLFPPVAHPVGVFTDEATGQDSGEQASPA